MRISFSLSVEDYVAFSVYHIRNSPSCQRARVLWGVVVPLVLFGFFGVINFRDGGWSSLPFAAIPGAFLVLWVYGGESGRTRKNARKLFAEGENRSLNGLQRLEATEGGLIDANELSESRFNWRMIERIADTPDYYFIYVGAAKGVIVPKQKVTEGDFEAFRRIVEERFRAVRCEAGGVFDAGRLARVDRPVVKAPGRYSGAPVLGIVSVVAGVAAAAMCGIILGVIVIGGWTGDAPEEGEQYLAAGLLAVLGFGANVVGLVTGVLGLVKESRKTGAIIGVIINGALMMGMLGLLALGLVVGGMS